MADARGRVRDALEKVRKKGWMPSVFGIAEHEGPEADFTIKFAMEITEPVLDLIRKQTPFEIVDVDKVCLKVRVPAEWISAPSLAMFPELEPEAELSEQETLWRLRVAYFAAQQSARQGNTISVSPADFQMSEAEVQRHFVSNRLMAQICPGEYHITPMGCKLLGVEYPKLRRDELPVIQPVPLYPQVTMETKSLVLTVGDGETSHRLLDDAKREGWQVSYQQYLATIQPNGIPTLRLAVLLERPVTMEPLEGESETNRPVPAMMAETVVPTTVFMPVEGFAPVPVLNSHQRAVNRHAELLREQFRVGQAVYAKGGDRE